MNFRFLDSAALVALIFSMGSQIDAKTLGRDTLAEGLGYATKTLKVSVGDLLFLLVACYFVARVASAKSWKKMWWPPLPCFALLFALIFSLLHSPTIWQSFGEGACLPMREALVEIVQWSAYFLVAPWIFVNLILGRHDGSEILRLDLAMRAFFFGMAANAIAAFAQLSLFETGAPRGLWTSPNIFAAFAAFSLPLLLETESEDGRSQTRFLILGFVLLGAALLTFASIWALIGLIFGLLISTIARPGDPKTKVFRLGVVGLVIVGATLSWRGSERLRGPREESIRLASDAQKVKKQFVEWQVATRFGATRERALATGFGPGNYQANIGVLYQWDSVPNEEKMPPDSNNLWLVQSASIGVFGLGALLWTIGHFWALAWRNRAHWLGAGVCGALASWIFVNFFHASIVRGAGLVLAFLLALAVVAGNLNTSKTVEGAEK